MSKFTSYVAYAEEYYVIYSKFFQAEGQYSRSDSFRSHRSDGSCRFLSKVEHHLVVFCVSNPDLLHSRYFADRSYGRVRKLVKIPKLSRGFSVFSVVA